MTEKEKIELLERTNSRLKQEVQKLRSVIKTYKYDELTGLLRRADFNDRLDELWYEHQEFGHRFIMAMIDLNGLHEVNRDVSFEAGDELIQYVASQLKELFEDSNLFRVGGDEFMILKRGNDEKHFAERLKQVKHSETYYVTTQEGYSNVSEMFNACDDGIIQKKKAKGNTRHSPILMNSGA